MNKQPHITEKTKKNLINSFWKLYKKEDLTKITVSRICENAKYERTTFYRYFIDISDVLTQIEDEVINNIRKDIANKQKKSSNILFDGFKKFTDDYGEYIIVFYEKGNITFYNKMKELIKNDVYEYLNLNIVDETKKEFLYEFMFSSLINSYAYWYRHKNNMSLEAFVKFANEIILNGTNSIKHNK